MFSFSGTIQKKALRFLDTLGTLSIIILEIWSFNMSDGGDCFQFPWGNENPRARTISFYTNPTKHLRTGLVHNAHREWKPFSNSPEQSTPNSPEPKGTNVLLQPQQPPGSVNYLMSSFAIKET